MNIILMGFRCTGKTAAGQRLAENMGLPFYDTDELVERQTGRRIPEIVADEGWSAFRAAEAAAIRELTGVDRSVIALGGGAVCDPGNVESLRGNGVFVWLFAGPEAIAARMVKDAAQGAERPSLTGEPSVGEMKAIMAEREPLYERLADIVVDTTKIETDRVVEAIRAGLRERLLEAKRIAADPEKHR